MISTLPIEFPGKKKYGIRAPKGNINKSPTLQADLSIRTCLGLDKCETSWIVCHSEPLDAFCKLPAVLDSCRRCYPYRAKRGSFLGALVAFRMHFTS